MCGMATSSRVARRSLLFVIVSLFCCAPEALGQRIRQNYRELSPAKRLKFRNALLAMKNSVEIDQLNECSDPPASVGGVCINNADCDTAPGNGVCDPIPTCKWNNKYDKYVCWHDRCGCVLVGGSQHSRPMILPWHRELFRRFEEDIRAMPGFQGVTIPYWKWTEPFPSHLDDSAQDNGFMGSTNGNPLVGQGFFDKAVWPVRTTATNLLPRDMFFRINASAVGSISQALVAAALAQPTYELFRPDWEGLHDQMHIGVGGELFDAPVAAEDPVFWLAHAYFDCVWAAWERTHDPDYRPDTARFGDAYEPGDDADDALTPWHLYKINPNTIRDVLNVRDLGYDYDTSHDKVVPAVSEWGLGALALLLLGAVAIKFGRRRAAAPSK